MNKGNLLKHIRLNHLTFKIMFKCPDCPNSYSDKSVLLGHRIMLHGARANFTCNFCHYGFVYKCQLRDHHRKKHSEPDENLIRKPAKTIDPKYINKDCEFKFQCHCGASFKYRHSFLDHMMMHKVKETGVKEFACDLCNVRFTIKCNLDRHNKAVHLKIKPFACLEKGCPKKFSTRAGLKVHQNFHNGNKPYICKFCETKYSDPSTLHKHLKVVHNEDKPYVKRL